MCPPPRRKVTRNIIAEAAASAGKDALQSICPLLKREKRCHHSLKKVLFAVFMLSSHCGDQMNTRLQLHHLENLKPEHKNVV